MTKKNPVQGIVLFDGMCNFCNAAVNFSIRHGGKEQFKFVPLHSEYAKKLLKSYGKPEDYSKGIVLIENKKIYFKSSAALHLARKLNRSVRWMYAFIIIPRFVRDLAYDWIASHRYHRFGKQQSCAVPHEF